MKKALFLLLLISSPAFAVSVVQYDEKSGYCLNYLDYQDEFKYMDAKGNPLPGWMIFTDKSKMTVSEVLSLLKVTPIYYMKKSGDPGIVPMDQSEIDAVTSKTDTDQLVVLGKQYKDSIENNLVIQTLIEQLAISSGADPVVLRDAIEQSIAQKLGLPNL